MKNFIKKEKQKNKGFSLIELLIVIVLIGIFSSMIGPGWIDFYRKKNLNYSVQIVKTTLAEGFSSARSQPKTFGIEVYKNTNEIKFFECTNYACSSKIYADSEKFSGIVTITSDDLEIRFKPPHGEMTFFDKNGQLSESIKSITIDLENKYKKTITLYKNSGLIED
ncbi:type II secretion system protein [Candidatus Gracilibacteria bacterium]|nr:type II secretion system protein [Candidatus Gracilibacteria bacterium]